MQKKHCLAAIALLLAASCATEDQGLRSEVMRMKKIQATQTSEISDIQGRLAITKGSAPSGSPSDVLGAIRQSQEGLNSKVTNFAKDFQQLQGRFEESRYNIDKSIADSKTDRDIFRAQLESMDNQMREMEIKLASIEAGMKQKGIPLPQVTLPPRPRMEMPKPAEVPPPSSASPSHQPPGPTPPAPAGPSTQAPAPPHGKGEQAEYQEAYQEFTAGRYDAAREKFTRFRSAYPSGAYAGNAVFWVGETYFKEGKFEDAIVSYQEMIKQYPSSEKVPAAKLKQGLSFLEIHDKETAEAILTQLTNEFPQSKEAEVARIKLRSLQKDTAVEAPDGDTERPPPAVTPPPGQTPKTTSTTPRTKPEEGKKVPAMKNMPDKKPPLKN